MLLSIDSWRLVRCLEENFEVGEDFTWEEMKKAAPPGAITPGRNDLARRLVNELIKAKRLIAVGDNLKSAKFKLND